MIAALRSFRPSVRPMGFLGSHGRSSGNGVQQPRTVPFEPFGSPNAPSELCGSFFDRYIRQEANLCHVPEFQCRPVQDIRSSIPADEWDFGTSPVISWRFPDVRRGQRMRSPWRDGHPTESNRFSGKITSRAKRQQIYRAKASLSAQ